MLNLFPFFFPSFPYGTQATLLHIFSFIVPAILITEVLCIASFLVPLRFCFKSPLPEMRWIGAALLFIFFEDFNRQLNHLRQDDVPHILAVPQDVPIGSLDFDLRAIAYLLFALVMLVAMTVRFRRLQARNQQVELDTEAARTVQRLLIPSQAPETPGFTIESVYIPAQEVAATSSISPPRPMAPCCLWSATSPAKA